MVKVPAIGQLSVDGAVAPEEVGPSGGMAPLAGLGHLPARPLTDDEAARVLHGGRVADEGLAAEAVALVAGGRLIAVGTHDGAGSLRPAVVLEDPR